MLSIIIRADPWRCQKHESIFNNAADMPNPQRIVIHISFNLEVVLIVPDQSHLPSSGIAQALLVVSAAAPQNPLVLDPEPAQGRYASLF